jgi:hypothetical protein
MFKPILNVYVLILSDTFNKQHVKKSMHLFIVIETNLKRYEIYSLDVSLPLHLQFVRRYEMRSYKIIPYFCLVNRKSYRKNVLNIANVFRLSLQYLLKEFIFHVNIY